MVQYGTIYGPEYGQPEIINGPEYGQPEIIKTQKFNSYQINVGQGNHLRTRCTKICCRGPYAVFLVFSSIDFFDTNYKISLLVTTSINKV